MLDMDGGRTESCTGASSGGEGDDSSRCCHCSYTKEEAEESGSGPCRRITSSPASFQGMRFLVFSCIILFLALGGVGNQGVGLATAGITLPVTRKFSQLKGSGTAEGESRGVTAEHAQQLRDHDYQRHLRLHGRALTSTTVADFPLSGSDDIGLYYTEIELGSPPSNYYVQVDTGSELLWVSCQPCPECPSSSDLEIPLRLYNPAASSTSSNTSCSSDKCTEAPTIAENPCVDDTCYYSFQYGDGSTAMGYLVEDTITYDTGVASNSSKSQYITASTKVTFGCGFNQTGESLTSSSRATDGIMGFGQTGLSVVAQLADQGLTTNEFAHCLQGDTGEGGIFVIGDVQQPGIVYTGIVQGQYHYNVVLESISMNGSNLNISSSAFDTNPRSSDSGTIFDSGTTLAIIVDEAYDAFMNELLTILATENIQPTYPRSQAGAACFSVKRSNLSKDFPSVTLQFEGAAMNLVPTNYLYSASEDDDLWCVGWSKSSLSDLSGLTILGDIVLKNKLVVYDLGKEQIGWVDHDCLSSISVSNGTASEVLNPFNTSGSYTLEAYHPIVASIISSVLIYAATFL